METEKAQELACLIRKHSNVFAAAERADTMIRFRLQPPPTTPPFIGMGRAASLDEELEIYREVDSGKIGSDEAVQRIKPLIENYYRAFT